MSYQVTLEILADPTRRAIIERLRAGPASVGQLAAGLTVSRPAVSKHLRLMKEADVVQMSEVGTRNLYRLNLAALAEVRHYLDSFWDTALHQFKSVAESTTPRKGKS